MPGGSPRLGKGNPGWVPSIPVKNEIKYQIVLGSQHAMKIVKQSNQHIKISGIYNNDKIIGIMVNRMDIPQEASDITQLVKE